jgi:ketosteroid isomerase-like protein
MKTMPRPAPLAGLTFAAALWLSACAHAPAAPRPDFPAAVEAHLATITDRNLAAFGETITQTDDIDVIFPNGGLIEGRTAVMDFHKEWFADPNWQMEPEVVEIIEGADQSTALIRYVSRDTPEGAPRSTGLVLVFQLENGSWRLVHDQTTRIAD